MSSKSHQSILGEHNGIKIDERFVLKLTKDGKNVNKEVKISCKVLQFSSEWSFEEVLASISELESKEYPQLFIFVIHTSNHEESLTKLQEILIKFGSNRPIILQISLNEAKPYLYLKYEHSEKFITANNQPDKLEDKKSFDMFFNLFMQHKFNDFEQNVLEILPKLQDRSLILKFLLALTLSEPFFGSMVLEVATNGSKAELLSALDVSFASNGRILNEKAQKYLSDVFEDDDDESNNNSVLLTAVKHKSTEIIDYLVTYCSHLIQQLPFDHQVMISTAAFETDQLDVLCDLLDIVDFPFPSDFGPKQKRLASHERIGVMIKERTEFHTAIKAKNFTKINEFVNKNQRIKFVFNQDNNSALTTAINSKKFACFHYLKSLDFQGENYEDILKNLNQDDKAKAVIQESKQRKSNVLNSKTNLNNPVLMLCTRASIHNSRISKEQDEEYRNKIMEWLKVIYKIAPEVINVAATCDHLKIIFDFESYSVENVSLSGSNVQGSTYTKSKWIFIGSKLSDRNREQQIKGVLAHELCHYVIHLVYENQENPYYKHMIKDIEKFRYVVETINKWSPSDVTHADDECNGTISSVFTDYNSEDFHPELIVRAVQILVQFDDEKVTKLQSKYIGLFGFWSVFVVPELRKFCNEHRQEIRNVNKIFELFGKIKNAKHELLVHKILKTIHGKQIVLIETNAPRMLLAELYQLAYDKDGDQFDIKTLFIDAQKLQDHQKASELKALLAKNPKLNIILDYTREENNDNIYVLQLGNNTAVTIIKGTNSHLPKLNDYMMKSSSNKNQKINYNWNDLTETTQKSLLNTKIYFRNKIESSLGNLLLKTIQPKAEELETLHEVIDDQLLNMLLESLPLYINKKNISDSNEKTFKLIFKPRNFQEKTGSLRGDKISEEKLLEKSKNSKYILLSDQAGNGKSWAMKRISLGIMQQNSENWVTYMDLKQFIDEFNAQIAENEDPEFSTFMVECILKIQLQFEAKIFYKLYKDGKVSILFDGFDEIAPNYAEFVSRLAQNFQQNGGNQLWIATRDYFEVDLKEKLKLDIAYCLDEMTNEEGIDLIAKSWLLADSKYRNQINSREELSVIAETPDFSKFQLKATKVVEKVAILKFRSIGLPQLFKMIADGFQDAKIEDKFEIIKMFEIFIQNLYVRWSDMKGKIRKQACIDSQFYQKTFYQFHQFHAILGLFPELAAILFPGYDGSEWPKEEIIACGLMGINHGKINFLHETFREFFAADAIHKSLASVEKHHGVKEFAKILADIFSVEKYEILRKFLCEMFIQDQKKSSKFQDILLNHLSELDLERLVKKYNFLREIIKSNLELSFLDEFIAKVEKKIGQTFVKDVLNTIDDETGNIFVYFLKFTQVDPHKFQEMLKILQKYDLFAILTNCNSQNQTILQVCIKNQELNWLKVVWHEIEQFYKGQNQQKIFIEILTKTDSENKNILHTISFSMDENLHRFLWNRLDLGNNKHLLTMAICKDKFNAGFLQYLLMRCKSPQIIELTFTQLEKNLLKYQFMEVLETIGGSSQIHPPYQNMDLLQTATYGCTILEVHQFLWKCFIKSFNDKEKFLKFLHKNYECDSIVLHIAAERSSAEIFSLFIKELEKLVSKDKIKKMLRRLGKNQKSLLQIAAGSNECSETHKVLWKTFKNYFNQPEMLKIIKHKDKSKENLLFDAVHSSNKNIVELTWNEIKSLMPDKAKQILYLKESHSNGLNWAICFDKKKFKYSSIVLLIITSLNKRNYFLSFGIILSVIVYFLYSLIPQTFIDV